jgi:serine/threonine protein kinase
MDEMNESLTLKGDRYHCERILGEGSMGRTYLATDQETGEKVAVKALFPSRLATTKDFELFEREATILQRMEHDQIPAYIDAFSEGEGEDLCYFIVQGFVEGETLQAVLQSRARFVEEDLVELMISLAEILEYIHNLDPRVVHRDIKPSNVILDPTGKKPSLVDFGAVREVVRLTMGGGSTIIGTFGYMPPEQLMGQAIPASDLYSLGITALECLARRTPNDLHGEDARRMIDEASISEDFRRVMRRLCEPRLDARYETARQVIEDLKAISQSRELIHAGTIEEAVERRLKDEARRLARSTARPVSLLAGTVALIMLCAVVVGGFLFSFALIDTLEAPLFMALGLSFIGMVIPLTFMTLRYTKGAWFAPRPSWIKTRGKTHEGATYRPETSVGPGPLITRIDYTFEVAGARPYKADNPAFRVRDFRLMNEDGEQDPRVGVEFDVFYPPGSPASYCRVDLVTTTRGGERRVETRHHFDHRIPHHPA